MACLRPSVDLGFLGWHDPGVNRGHRSIGFLLALAAAASITWIVVPSLPARAECLPIQISVRPMVVDPGGTVTIEGEGWRSCEDTASGACKRSHSVPFHAIRLELRAVGHPQHAILLGPVHADGGGGFVVTARLPDDALHGKWSVIGSRGEGWQPEDSASFGVRS